MTARAADPDEDSPMTAPMPPPMRPPATPPDTQRDERWMRAALAAAELARAAGEVPVGAVLVQGERCIATAFNQPIGTHDPCAHAEIGALRAAGAALGNYRLPDCELFVTLEPCVMCAGAIMHARLARVVYGARDPKTGACGSVVDAFALTAINHHTDVHGGVLADACAASLRSFFAARRAVARAARQADTPGATSADPTIF